MIRGTPSTTSTTTTTTTTATTKMNSQHACWSGLQRSHRQLESKFSSIQKSGFRTIFRNVNTRCFPDFRIKLFSPFELWNYFSDFFWREKFSLSSLSFRNNQLLIFSTTTLLISHVLIVLTIETKIRIFHI